MNRWWSDSMGCCCYLRAVQDLLADGKTPYERRLGERFKGPVIHLVQWLNFIRLHRKIRQEFINLARMYHLESFLAKCWSRENLERRCLDSWPGRFGNVGCKSRQRKCWSARKMMNSFSRSQMYRKIVWKRLRFSRIHSEAGTTCEERRFKVENFKVNRESLSRQNQQMTLKPVPTFGRFKGTSSIVITMNLEFNSLCRRKKHWNIPLKYIDVTRSTCIDLDVMQEKRVDDCWNVDSNRSLSDSWKGFTKFTLLKEKPPKGFLWSRRRLTKVQTTTRPEHAWPEVWTKNGKAAQNREKQEWKNEEPKLDNARRLGGTHFIDPDDQD